MLFVAEYEVRWDMLEAAVAKRLEWDEGKPDDFRFLGEYVWPAGEPPFRGIAVFEAAGIEAVNAFVLHYGPAVTMRVHTASDVVSAIRQLAGETGAAPAKAAARPRRKRARRA